MGLFDKDVKEVKEGEWEALCARMEALEKQYAALLGDIEKLAKEIGEED
jgi:hypothetical protein